ncbi:HD domain-containing protein [Promicromonospora sp. NPDC050262]|uniref:HD domain-containing protein n=1 Tax=Promicromonospora sp. NPDC050262 TaxID=3155036 RepID=UPI0033D5FA79
MQELTEGPEIPRTAVVAEATERVRSMISPVIYHHSRRVYLFGLLHARRLGLRPNRELLYVSAMFHDVGLAHPFSEAEQRFEVDGADHARRFLVDSGFPVSAAETVWAAVALHTTPGIPGRMAPEIAVTQLGVLTDVLGFGLDELDPHQVEEIVAAHPRGDFKNEFLRETVEGLRHRPETANGTVNADILEHFIPGLRLTTTVERVLGSPWQS